MIDLPSRLIYVILSSLLGAAAGYYVTGKIKDVEYLELKQEYNQASSTAKQAAADKLAADTKAANAIAALDISETRASNIIFNSIRKETAHVKDKMRVDGIPPIDMPIGWVRQYNAALSASSSRSSTSASIADDTSARADADPSKINNWDILDNSIDNAESFGACRRQLNSLIDWVESTN